MPRLPDYTSLDNGPALRSNRSIVQDRSGEIMDRAIEGFGNSVTKLADERHVQAVNLARAQASNALLDNEIAVRAKADDIQKRVQTGELPYDQARTTFDKEIGDIERPSIKNLDPVGDQNFRKGLERNAFTSGLSIDKFADDARKTDFKDQFTSGLDKLGKLAGMPGADIDGINAKADAFAPLARAAGIPANIVAQAVQSFKDKNWQNDATQKAMESANSLPALKQLQHDLTASDGFYAGKLDTDKRNAILRSVLNDQQQIQNRIEHEADRRDAKGQRALYSIDQQIASGVPATADMWSEWASTVKGTPAEAEFKDRVANEQEVQDVLRKPVGEQQAFVQQKIAALDTQGGSVREKANLTRLATAVNANVKQMETAPLLFAQNRTGTSVQPLDFSAINGPGFTEQVSDRVATLTAMRKEYGSQVPMRPLLPQEVAQLSGALDKASPKQQAELFAMLNQSVGDTDAYKGIMQQIAPDSPVRALAGMLAGKQRSLTLNTHMFGPDDITTGGDVAATMLQGQRLLDATKEQKTEDGKPTSKLFLPETTTLQGDFQDKVGAAFAGRPAAAQVAFQAMQSYYVGKAAQTGKLAANKSDIDSSLVKEAITATLGSVVDFNGNGEVLAPWGMDESTFEDRAQQALNATGVGNADQFGLRNLGDGTYYVTQGRNFLYDKAGKPVLLDLNPPTQDRKGVIRR